MNPVKGVNSNPEFQCFISWLFSSEKPLILYIITRRKFILTLQEPKWLDTFWVSSLSHVSQPHFFSLPPWVCFKFSSVWHNQQLYQYCFLSFFFLAQRRSALSGEPGKAPPRWWLWSQTGSRTTGMSCQTLWRNAKAETSPDTPSLWVISGSQWCSAFVITLISTAFRYLFTFYSTEIVKSTANN